MSVCRYFWASRMQKLGAGVRIDALSVKDLTSALKKGSEYSMTSSRHLVASLTMWGVHSDGQDHEGEGSCAGREDQERKRTQGRRPVHVSFVLSSSWAITDDLVQ